MKRIFFIFILCLSIQAVTAQKYISRNGHIWFYSSTPLEDIEAHNHQVASVLDVNTGELVFNVLIKSFEFKKALMQEHFNENYMESAKLPKANFKGKINNFKSIDFTKDGSYSAEVSGDLTIHGVTKPVTTKGTLVVKNGAISATSKFIVQPVEYNIQIPKIVEGKIAKNIDVNVDLTYSKM